MRTGIDGAETHVSLSLARSRLQGFFLSISPSPFPFLSENSLLIRVKSPKFKLKLSSLNSRVFQCL